MGFALFPTQTLLDAAFIQKLMLIIVNVTATKKCGTDSGVEFAAGFYSLFYVLKLPNLSLSIPPYGNGLLLMVQETQAARVI